MVKAQSEGGKRFEENMVRLMEKIKEENRKAENEKNENEFIFKVCDGIIKDVNYDKEYFILDIGTTLLAHLPLNELPNKMIQKFNYDDKLQILITGKDFDFNKYEGCEYYFSAKYYQLNKEQKEEWENVYLSYKNSKPIEAEIVETNISNDAFEIIVNICSGIKVSLTFEEIIKYNRSLSFNEKNQYKIRENEKNKLQVRRKIYNYLMEKNNADEKISIIIKKFNNYYKNNIFGNIVVCFANEIFEHDNGFENLEKIKYNNEQIENIIKNKKNKYFIFDTNIIMNYPEFLYVFQKSDEKYACVPFVVLEELDKIKNSDENMAKKAQKALKILYKMKGLLRFEIPYPDLLPLGLDKKKNDNLIISIAIHWKNDGAEIITDDIGLLVKAYSMNIDTWTLSNYI